MTMSQGMAEMTLGKPAPEVELSLAGQRANLAHAPACGADPWVDRNVRVRFNLTEEFLERACGEDEASWEQQPVLYSDTLFDTDDFQLLQDGCWLTRRACEDGSSVRNEWRLKFVAPDADAGPPLICSLTYSSKERIMHFLQCLNIEPSTASTPAMKGSSLRCVAYCQTARYDSLTANESLDFACATVLKSRPTTFIVGTRCAYISRPPILTGSDITKEIAGVRKKDVAESNMAVVLYQCNKPAYRAAFPGQEKPSRETMAVEGARLFYCFDEWIGVTARRDALLFELHEEFSEELLDTSLPV